MHPLLETTSQSILSKLFKCYLHKILKIVRHVKKIFSQRHLFKDKNSFSLIFIPKTCSLITLFYNCLLTRLGLPPDCTPMNVDSTILNFI